MNIDTETDFDSWRLILAEYLQIDFTSVKRKKNGDVSYEYTEEFQCQHGRAYHKLKGQCPLNYEGAS